jgi:hypothetical protein
VDYLASNQPPLADYSNYKFDQPSQHQHHPSQENEYDIHSQVYRPTENELRTTDKKSQTGGHRGRRLEAQGERVDHMVNRLFRKLEKKIG